MILQPLIVVHIGAIIEEKLNGDDKFKVAHTGGFRGIKQGHVIATWSVLHFSMQHQTAVAHIIAITDETFTTTVKFPVKIQISLQPYNGCPGRFMDY